MYNPFAESNNSLDNDAELVAEALGGAKNSLEKLILRHQSWIYNIAFRMVFHPNDAEDITQEILIKMITKLSTFDSNKASFRTWLYRITANHVINMRVRKNELKTVNTDHLFQHYRTSKRKHDFSSLPPQEFKLLVEESRLTCLNGMILCLERRDRLVFILGDMFGVGGDEGGRIMNITAVNFRKILSRSRQKLSSFMNSECGLINPNNPCRCARHIEAAQKLKLIGKSNKKPSNTVLGQISDVIKEDLLSSDESERTNLLKVFRNQAFYSAPNLTKWLDRVLQSDGLY